MSSKEKYPIKVAVFGSTGSIGTSAMEVIRSHPGKFEVVALIAGENAGLLSRQAHEFKPRYIGLNSAAGLTKLKELCGASSAKFLNGQEEIAAFAASSEYELMLGAIVGFAGLQAVVSAAQAGKIIALANKESLVAGGALVTSLCSKHGAQLIPVDSEHSAIFQLVEGLTTDKICKISLTASGGPFFSTDISKFPSITPEQALRHPKWKMGKKNSLDSASMFNKALELIEAHWLFGLEAKDIEVVVHPQSIVHSFVHFPDGTALAQLSVPDMKGPIAYALHYPHGRLSSVMPQLDLMKMGQLDFHSLDNRKFPAVELARQSLTLGRAAGAVFNAANEVAGEAFLQGKLGFERIPAVVSTMLERMGTLDYADFGELAEIDREVRIKAGELF